MSRIASLPLRDPTFDEREIGPLTRWLRTRVGTMTLRPIQARTGLEVLRVRGVFSTARVGAGKTLSAGLSATLLGAKRPLIVTDASMVDDTKKLLDVYRQHWHIPRINVVSYHKISIRSAAQRAAEKAGREPPPGFLEDYDPDYIGLDEVHRLRRVRQAACARRFSRFFHQHKNVAVCAFSGSPVRKTLKDWVHICVWALKKGAPVPLEPDVQSDWALLLDDELPTKEGYTVLPKYEILQPHLGDSVVDRDTALEAFQHRLLWTPGVVISPDSFEDVPLTITPRKIESPPALEEHWTILRDLRETPDGWPLPDPMAVYTVACQLALGFFYRYDPRPPEDWANARRAWCKFCRDVLDESSQYDTETQVRDACMAGRLPSWAWDAWEAIRDRFVPNTVPEWLSRHAVHEIVQWGRARAKEPGGGIIWSNYRALSEAIHEEAGWPWYGPKGRDAQGHYVRDARPDVDPVIILSTKVGEVGKNLQGDPTQRKPGYSANLFTTPPRASSDWEQRLGRTHRDGQLLDVSCEYLVGCLENFMAMPISRSLALMSEKQWSQPQKLLRWSAEDPPVAWALGPAYGETDTAKRKRREALARQIEGIQE